MKAAQSPYDYFDSRIFSALSTDVLLNDFRFNAEYYEENSSITIDNSVEFFPLSKIASVIFPGIFKRNLVVSTDFGIKFLTTSDIMMIEPETDKILSEYLTTNLPIYRVSEHMLLVSRSGSIGNTIYVDDRLKDFAITEDALRVKPFDDRNIGLLYFYFTSEYGNGTITGKKSGAVIDHIYEDDLLKLPIPKFDDVLVDTFLSIYLKVKSSREESDKLIKHARLLVLHYNNLPPLSTSKPETIDPDGEVEIRMTGLDEFTQDYRLDSHFYNPMAKLVIDNIISQRKYEKLGELSNDIILGKRFKRNYVESEFGTPFLSGKNIIQIRPDMKYLSDTEISFIDELLIKQNWTLISCSGTLGRVAFVYKNYENYAASQHILRVNPNENLIDPAYLNCFLSTEYGYHQLLRYRYGSVIDEIDDKNIEGVLIAIPSKKQQKEIGDLVRKAYEMRAEAIKLEDEAQELLTQALTQA